MKKLLEQIKKHKWIQYVFLGALSLLIVSIFTIGSFTEEKSVNNELTNDYVSDLENKLSNSLSKVTGAGKVSVVITVSGGNETILAMETVTKTNVDNSVTITETPILVNGKTVVLSEKYPKITGVLIVAQGADNIVVSNKLKQVAVSLLDIEAQNVEILSMS